ncbi:uncharacterized protein G2W53_022737 [Senna tora]|uniref:Uncharacterized protein n=1 Tax=Senna tora TaxID=362788 RepID=A0A834TLN2_9FABA|nr:uncharacterized protein G2W53_022737 [Senna tora]
MASKCMDQIWTHLPNKKHKRSSRTLQKVGENTDQDQRQDINSTLTCSISTNNEDKSHLAIESRRTK